MDQLIPEILKAILAQTPELRQSFLVGGCVRDWILGVPVKDVDIEVFGVGYADLVEALSRWGRADLVGRSFGVVKLSVAGGFTFDFSVPRRDSKVAAGHKGFVADIDPDITLREAASRRDYTLNALAFDPRRGQLIDPFGGEADLRARILRHIGSAFVDDPLRVLRGMQFAGRFELEACPETIALCQSMVGTYSELAVERVREEWFKWAAKSRRPSAGLKFLVACGWIAHFPEVKALIGVPQDSEWHPEGDVFTHTCHAVDALVELPEWQSTDEESRVVFTLAVLAHDFGKPAVTQFAIREGRSRVVSPGHEVLGGPLALSFLTRIDAPRAVRERVVPLVQNHMAHLQQATARSVRRLARRLIPETVRGLATVVLADHFGRPPLPKQIPAKLMALLEIADQASVLESAPKPILMGRHLLELGVVAGPGMGRLLAAAFEAQLDGEFVTLEGAYQWLLRQSPDA